MLEPLLLQLLMPSPRVLQIGQKLTIEFPGTPSLETQQQRRKPMLPKRCNLRSSEKDKPQRATPVANTQRLGVLGEHTTRDSAGW